MRRSASIFMFAVLLVGAVSCNTARIRGNITGLPEGSTLLVKRLDGSARTTVDSAKVDGKGRFGCNIRMDRGDRDFFFIYREQRKLASLILSPGETVEVACDTLGRWTVDGSQECEDLRQNELALAAISRLDPLTMKEYIAYYRKSLSFVMSHSHSLTVIPVLFQKIRNISVFGQPSDGVIFDSVADSLETVYPDSRYLALLRTAAKEKINEINLKSMLENASAVSYPSIELKDINGKPCKLSDTPGRKTLLVFWDASNVKNRLFNADVLLPAYEKYGKDRLDIYQVGALSDKATWAVTVRQQALPWTNVFDGVGGTVKLYGVTSLPCVVLIEDGNLKKIVDPDFGSVMSALN